MELPEKTSPKRQCWACLRRRLVCDFTQPSCKKCEKAGKECPGYDPHKPLQWVAPGKVTARHRKVQTSSSIKSKSKSEKQKKSDTKEEVALEFGALTLAEEAGAFDVEDIPRQEYASEVTSFCQSNNISLVSTLGDVPGFELTNETFDVVQAVHYCKPPSTTPQTTH